MHGWSLRSCLVSAAVVTILVIGPNLLGLGASVLPRTIDRALSRSASIGLELLPIPVGVLVVVVVAYVLLTPGRRRSAADRRRGAHTQEDRRFLPPVEIALLQLGNLSFLVFAVIVALAALGGLFYLLRVLTNHPLLTRTNFTISLGLAVLAMLVPLRPATSRTRLWQRFPQEWLRRGGRLAVAIAAFGLIGALQGIGPLRVDLEASQLRLRTLTLLYGGLIAGLLSCGWMAGIAKARGWEDKSGSPLRWFVPASALAWAVNVGLSALFLNGVFLTLHAHLGEP